MKNLNHFKKGDIAYIKENNKEVELKVVVTDKDSLIVVCKELETNKNRFLSITDVYKK